MDKINKAINFDVNYLNNLKEDERSCVTVVKTIRHLALHPFHLPNVSNSIKVILCERIAKYDKKLNGIILGFQNVKLLGSVGVLNYDTCFTHLEIEVEFFVFRAEVGKVLNGLVSKKSKDHVGCLVHLVFNISLPRPEHCEDWLGDRAQVGQDIEFRITFTDFEGRLPYIKANFVSILSEDSGISTCEEGTNQTSGFNTRIKFDIDSDTNVGDEDESAVSKTKKRKRKLSESSTEVLSESKADVEKIRHKKHKKQKRLEHELIDESFLSMLDDSISVGNSSTKKKKKRQRENFDEIITEKSHRKKKKKKPLEFDETNDDVSSLVINNDKRLSSTPALDVSHSIVNGEILKIKKIKNKKRSISLNTNKLSNHNPIEQNGLNSDNSSTIEKRKKKTTGKHKQNSFDDSTLFDLNLDKLFNESLAEARNSSGSESKRVKKNKSTKKKIDLDETLPDLNLDALFNEGGVGSKSAVNVGTERNSTTFISWSNKTVELPSDSDLDEILSGRIGGGKRRKHQKRSKSEERVDSSMKADVPTKTVKSRKSR